MDYFNHPSVSNSKLGELWHELYHSPQYDPRDAYAFGNLIDAMITEPHRVGWFDGTLDGIPQKDFDKAIKMHRAFNDNQHAVTLLKHCEFQRVTIKNRKLNYNGIPFELQCRCKWDFFSRYISGDIKSTMATSQKQFEAACEHFHYWRGRAWYMDLENRDKDILIGISKVNYKLFFVPIRKGDERYNKGKEQYLSLAFKYWALN